MRAAFAAILALSLPLAGAAAAAGPAGAPNAMPANALPPGTTAAQAAAAVQAAATALGMAPSAGAPGGGQNVPTPPINAQGGQAMGGAARPGTPMPGPATATTLNPAAGAAPTAIANPATAAPGPTADSSGAAPGADAAAKAVPAEINLSSVEDLQRLRDPFKRPDLGLPVDTGPREGLENFDLGALKMVGLLTGPRKTRAVVLAPDAKTYIVSQNSKVGRHQGVVWKITDRAVIVREKVRNVIGQIENVDTPIGLQAESRVEATGGIEGVANPQQLPSRSMLGGGIAPAGGGGPMSPSMPMEGGGFTRQ